MKPLATFQDFEDFLSSRTNYERVRTPRSGQDMLRLDRMRALLHGIGNPLTRYSAVHVAGTKGKGSTTLILEALLRAEGLRVGSYTSPHVEHIRERIRVDGRPVSKADLVSGMNRILPALALIRAEDGSTTAPTFFELMTALAMLHFAQAKVDWAIFEVGLGGRLDATNVINPRWSTITSLGLEHTRVLGSTLAAIAREKAGIIKPGAPVVIGQLPREGLEVVLRIARDRGAEVLQTRGNSVRNLQPGSLEIDGFSAPIKCDAIRGPALRADLAVALRLHQGIVSSLGIPLRQELVARALLGLELPARVEVFEGNPPIVLDGAHTKESFRALRRTLEEIRFPTPRVLVLSIAADKPMEPMIDEVLGLANDFIVTRADPVRSLPPEELRCRLGRGRVVEEPEEALAAAVATQHAVVVSGSIYLAGALRSGIRGCVKTP